MTYRMASILVGFLGSGGLTTYPMDEGPDRNPVSGSKLSFRFLSGGRTGEE